MQANMRFNVKQQCATTQQLVAIYLQANTVKRVAAKQHSSKQLRSLHIGKNCSTRSGARV